MRQKLTKLFSLLAVCFMLAAYCTTAQAALLDVGPTVPQVIGSTVPNLGHGYPSWYRDTNRLPLELCLNEAMCFYAPNTPGQPDSFPLNIADELFFYAADAAITLPGVNQRAILVQVIEAAYSTGNVVPGAQITFARIRVRIDTDRPGTYVVTTPYKQLTFTVANDPTAIADGINFTEDIGIGADGVFTGALAGTVGPFLYCTDAPFPATDGSGGSYIGKNALACPVLGSTFTDPVTGQPANLFRIQGPAGFGGTLSGTVETRDFRVQGKIHTNPTATPLTVDRATYTRDAVNTQVEVFATTQPISNQTTGLPPFSMALANIPSTLEFTDATDTVPRTVMLTNNAIDGKFFAASASFANPETLPLTVTVTNIADVPLTSINVPLVDEVIITEASFAPTPITLIGGTLKVVALSGDKLALPTLTVSMKDGLQNVVLGTITGGSGTLTVPFPLTKTLPAPIGTKTYNIPPESITVTSEKLGIDTNLVSNPLVQVPVAPVAASDTATVASGGSVTIDLVLNDKTTNTGASLDPASISIAALPVPTKGAAVNNGNGTITYTQSLPSAIGTDTFTYTIKDTTGTVSNVATVTVTINNPPLANADPFTTNEDTPAILNVIANDIDPDAPFTTLVPASVLVTLQPAHGTAVALGNGTVRYTPILAYNGPDSFEYTVRDTLGAVSVAAATVSVTVTPVADSPLTVNDSANTLGNTPVSIDVLLNDSHPDGTVLPNTFNLNTLTIAASPLHGTAVPSAGKVLYTPALNFFGTDSFTYFVSDNNTPARVSASATVTVIVTPVNIPPTANNDVASTFVGTPRSINVIGNDTDPDGTINPASVILSAVSLSGVPTTNATLVAGTTAGTYAFTATVAGTYTFTYTVKDNLGATSLSSATVTVSVTAPVTDSVSVLKAQFVTNTNQWNVEGSTTGLTTALRMVTLHIGNGVAGQVIGTAIVAADGRWKFQSNVTGVPANAANRTISASLPSGASRLAFPVAIK